MIVEVLEAWKAKLPEDPERTWEGKIIPKKPARTAQYILAKGEGGIVCILDLDTTRLPEDIQVGQRVEVACAKWPERELRATATGRTTNQKVKQ